MSARMAAIAGRLVILLLAAAPYALGHSAQAKEPPADRNVPPLLVERIHPDRVQFASESLRMRYDAIRQRIEGMVDAGWKHEPLTLTQQKWDRRQYFCTASWQRNYTPEPDWKPFSIPYPRPVHQISLVMQPTRDNPRVMETLELNVAFVPPYNGWKVDVRLKHTVGGADVLMMWFNHNQRHVADNGVARDGIYVPNAVAGARDRPQGSDIELLANAHVDWGPYQRQLITAVATPQTLRDLELKLCDELEAALRRNIQASRLGMIDWTYVRSDNPPRQMPIGPGEGSPVSEQAQQRLIDDGVRHLDERRERWKSEYVELHEAVRLAFPALVEWAARRQGASPE